MRQSKISEAQVSALIDILDGKPSNIKKQTINALIASDYIDKNTLLLTKAGFNRAIEVCPLEKQCEHLKIKLEVVKVYRKNKHPENDLMSFYEDRGLTVIWDETGSAIFGNLVMALFYDLIHKYYKTIFPYLSDDELSVHIATFSPVGYLPYLKLNEIQDSLANRNIKEIDIEKIYKLQKQYYSSTLGINYDYSNSLKISKAAINILSVENIISFIENYQIDTGWPDLVLSHSNTLELVEVKTTDKLHTSQIIQIQNIQKYLPYAVKIVKVERMKMLL